MVKQIEGKLTGTGRKAGIVVSRFNTFITERLLEGALDGLVRHGVEDKDITVARCPGAFEIPLVAKKMAASGKFDVVICLGAVIRGSTPHFDYICAEVSKGIASASLELGFPIVYGIITADTIEQAVERAGTKMGNKGFDAALTALELADLMDKKF
jgi:6,7-dimethyl-8-ribityllumazine synthase